MAKKHVNYEGKPPRFSEHLADANKEFARLKGPERAPLVKALAAVAKEDPTAPSSADAPSAFDKAIEAFVDAAPSDVRSAARIVVREAARECERRGPRWAKAYLGEALTKGLPALAQ